MTDEQKDKMSERQIELWEEKAKEGLLHRDSAVDSFLSQMRLALYTKPAGAKLALYDIGIETTKWEDKGQLKMD
ncbi:flagellar filament capping protein FliD, partial [Slackia exigua]|uniref:flagellar filament capping protein FliD n=1 Tax=Slackia exigua TaxID=84109 RepID=UPI0021097DF3